MITTILFIASNPIDTAPLRIGREIKGISDALKLSSCNQMFKFEFRITTTPTDLRRALLEYHPAFVHFSGHGEGEAGILIEDDNGKAKLVTSEMLTRLFELFSNEVECILLNSCYSEIQADAISKNINWVIGMRHGISDDAAIIFSIAFYDAIGAGEDIEFAYRLASNALLMECPEESETPVLKTNPNRSNTNKPTGLSDNDITNAENKTQLNAPRHYRKDPVFTGRNEKLSEVIDAIKNFPIVTLKGVGGVGKTALAHEALAFLQSNNFFPSGIYAIDLTGIRRYSSFLDELNSVIGVDIRTEQLSPSSSVKLLLSVIQEKNILIAFDNAEDLLGCEDNLFQEFIRLLIIDSNFLHIFVTSRASIGMEKERIIFLDLLQQDASYKVIKNIIKMKGISVDNLKLKKITDYCSGLPLALKLVAKDVLTYGCDAIYDKINTEYRITQLERSLARSWQATGASGQEVLLVISKLPSGATSALLEDIGFSTIDINEAAKHSLTENILDRWYCHDLVNNFIKKIAPEKTSKDIKYKLCKWFLDKLRLWNCSIHSGNEQSSLKIFSDEKNNLENIISTLEPSEETEKNLLISILSSATSLYLWSGNSLSGLHMLKDISSNAYIENTEQGAELSYAEAKLAYFSSNYRLAVEASRRALTNPCHKKTYQLHYLLSASLRGLGELSEAKTEMLTGLTLCETEKDQENHPNFLKELGVISDSSGHPTDAVKFLRQAILEYQVQNNKIGFSFATQCLGGVERHRCNYLEAQKLAKEAIKIGEKSEERRVQGYGHLDLGILYIEQGKWQLAWKHLKKSESYFSDISHHSAVYRVLLNKSKIYIALGKLKESWFFLHKCNQFFMGNGETYNQISSELEKIRLQHLCNYGEIKVRQDILSYVKSLGYPRLLAETYEKIAATNKNWKYYKEANELWIKLENTVAARRCHLATESIKTDSYEALVDILTESTKCNDLPNEALAAYLLSKECLRIGNSKESEAWILHSINILKRYGTIFELRDAELLYYELLSMKKQDISYNNLIKTIDWYSKINSVKKVVRAIRLLDSLSTEQQEYMDFLCINDKKEFIFDWNTPFLSKLVDSNRVLIALKSPPETLISRLEKSIPPPFLYEGTMETRMSNLAARHLITTIKNQVI